MRLPTILLWSVIYYTTLPSFHAFNPLLHPQISKSLGISSSCLLQNKNDNDSSNNDNINSSILGRREMITSSVLFTGFAAAIAPQPSTAQVYFDPAQYGDQELRIGAVDSVKESVRRSILQNPQLAPSFYQLALLDGLSYNAQTQKFGPDGRVVINVLSSKATDPYTKNLQDAALSLIETEKKLRKKVQISLADAIAIGGAESIETIGGPLLTVQLGRPDPPRDGTASPIDIDLFSGKRSNEEVMMSFRNAGMTDREATALLAGLLTLDKVEKTRTSDDWKASARPKFREPGKIGRMSEYRALTEEDIAQAELDAELGKETDDGWYIADSFGTKDQRFGQRLAVEDINDKNFNKYLKDLVATKSPPTKATSKSNKSSNPDTSSNSDETLFTEYGWTGQLLLDSNYPTTASWLQKYSSSNLNFLKDLNIAYNSVTQLGAIYTGGKYEALLKNKPRKSLNDDDLKLF